MARESVAEFRKLKDKRGEARALETSARILDHTGDHRTGADLHRQAIELGVVPGDAGLAQIGVVVGDAAGGGLRRARHLAG